MPIPANPAIPALLGAINPDLVFAQVLITRQGSQFELRHVQDQPADQSSLARTPVHGLRDLAQTTEHGAFRPLKSAPHLRRGWFTLASSPPELAQALDHLYPGGLADWFAVHSGQAQITDYEPYTERQTGMYRSTHNLKEAAAARMIQACCHPDFCLKRRLWTSAPLPPDDAADKSALPCLEPCALLLEFARTAWKLEQEEPTRLTLNKIEADSIRAALLQVLHPSPAPREGDFSAPTNPRKLRWILRKLEETPPQ